jgi:hypothetical protein
MWLRHHAASHQLAGQQKAAGAIARPGGFVIKVLLAMLF